MSTLMSYIPSDHFLKDKVIAVSGASAGIGQAVAKACAATGATVVLLGSNETNLQRTYDDIVQQKLPEPVLCQLDLQTATEEQYNQLSHLIGDNYGQLHGLVHCAGVLGKMTTLEQYPLDVWQQAMQVNVTAAFLLTRALLPCLRQADQSSVIFTSSSVGRKGRAHWGAYSISKFAVEGMMQTFADEERNLSNVHINSFNPGATRTAMRASAYPAENPETLKTSEQVAQAYLYLLSLNSRQLHGCAVNFDDEC